MVREEDLPIDIYYNKTLDWLIDRRHCNVRWQEKASFIREQINTAIQDMPPNDDIAQLLSGSYINYFHCNRIVELLKVCGEGSTNFFGQYSSKRMKDWQTIVQLYSEDSIFLAEAAHMLIANVNFEIPGMKRTISKCQQMQQECSRKEQDCTTNSALFREKYRHVCKEMGLVGDNVRSELMQQVETLPDEFNTIAHNANNLKLVVEYYHAFVSFVTQRNNNNSDVCPLLQFVIANGNTTVYQWKTGKVPTTIEEQEEKIDLQAMAELTNDNYNTEEEEIDWGGDDDVIDFGDGDADADGGIDWGGDDSGVSIDIDQEDCIITVQDAGHDNPDGDDGGNASGDEAQSILQLTQTRNVFIAELLELQAFLEQRIYEMKCDADMITVHQLQSAPQIIQMNTKEGLEEMLLQVTTLLIDLTSKKMKNLYLIKSSPRYVDRIADSLLQKLHTSDKLLKQVSELRKKSREAVETQIETEPKLQVLVKKTKILQKQIEGEISKRYKNRKVNIMGEINLI